MNEQTHSEHPPRAGSDSLNSEQKQAPPLKQPQLEIRKSGRHFEIVGLVSTFLVFAITSGTATLILGWLYAFHDPVAAGGTIMSAVWNGTFVISEASGQVVEGSISSQAHAQTLRILTFSALASHLVSLTSTILVSLLAYRSANQWLRASENPYDIHLTPIQYGLLVRTLGSGSLMSLINTLRYTCRSKRATAPRLFKEAFVGVAGIYILSHIVGVIDLWLHSRARSISVFRAVPVQSEELYGITYNDTTCGTFEMTGLPCQNLISTLSNGTYWADDQRWIYLEGFGVMSGTNPDLALEYVNDTAILVPGPNRNFKFQGFNINTQGLHVECTNLRDSGDRLQSPFPISIGSGSRPVTNCSKAGYPHFPYYTSGELDFSGNDTRSIQSLILGIIRDEMGGMLHGTADFSSGWTSNPATTIVQLRRPGLGGYWWNHDTPCVRYLNVLDLYGKCKMTYLDVIAQYDPIGAKWAITETSLSRSELASILWTPMIFQLLTADLQYAVTPYMFTGHPDVLDILASSMSKYGMAYTAPLMKFTAAFNITTPQPVALGLYPVVPTLLMVGCLYIYSLTALVIFLLSCTSTKLIIFVPRELTRKQEQDKKKSALDVAQSWLTDPLSLVGLVFPGRDGRHVTRSAKSDPLDQVYDSKLGLEKLGIGLHDGSKGEMIFGLMRQCDSQTGQLFPVVHEGDAMREEVARQSSGPELPARGRKSDESPSSLKGARLSVRNSCRRFRVIGLLPTLCVVAITGGTGTLVLGWLCAFQDPVENGGSFLSALRNGSFVITESSTSGEFLLSQVQTSETLRILLFSALASHIVSVASTVLATLLAYRAATQWLRASENPDDANLTPIQYGLLVRTLGTGSLMSIINGLRYVCRSTRGKTPRLFKEALISVTGIYLLTHVVGLIDLWLHSRARAVSVIRPIPFETEAPYGITYSDEKCGPFQKAGLPCQKMIGLGQGRIIFSFETVTMFSASWYAILGANPYFKLEYINGTTIIAPGPTRSYQSQGFNFNTHGLRVECNNLKDRCERLATPLPQYLVQGESPVINCSEAGYPNIPYYATGELSPQGIDTRNIRTLVLGIIGDEMGGMINGTADFSSAWTPNPASTVVQIRWPDVIARDTDVAHTNIPDLYATCSLTYLDIVAQYAPLKAEWSILETNLSSPELASVFWTPLIFQWAETHLLHALKPYMAESDAQVMQILEVALGRANMGVLTGLMKFIPASNVTTPRPVALGVYPTAPILLLIACLYVYSLIAVVAFVLASISNRRIISVLRYLTKEGERDEERSALDITQAWLTDPLPFIGSLFPGRDGREIMRSVETDPLRQVYDSSWGLEKVGIGLYKGSQGEMIFGLRRQSHPRSRRYGRVFSVEDVNKAIEDKDPIDGDAASISSLPAAAEAAPDD